MLQNNLFANIPTDLPKELTEILTEGQGNIRIERILSHGHHSPEGFWYDQPANEWVALLKGSATIAFADNPSPVHLAPGDWIEIKAHRRHRITHTSPHEHTVWLAVFFDAQS